MHVMPVSGKVFGRAALTVESGLKKKDWSENLQKVSDPGEHSPQDLQYTSSDQRITIFLIASTAASGSS